MYPGPAEIMCDAKLEPSPRVGDTAERQLLFGLFYSGPVLSTFPNHSYKPAVKQKQRHTDPALLQPQHRGEKIQVWNTLSLLLRRFAASPLPLPMTDCLFSLVSPYPNVYVMFLFRSQGGELVPHHFFTALSF
jgi:hypothetical protein